MPILLPLIILSLCVSCGCTRVNANHTQVNSEDLVRMNTKVIGSSGLVFGTIFYAEGKLTKNSLPTKNEPWSERLLVHRINDLEVAEPYLININSNYHGVNLEATDRIELLGYETGGFFGQPQDFSRYTDFIPADYGYCFIESFVVIRQENSEE